ISISGPFVSTTSTVKRPPPASVTARCNTFSELARHMLTFTPYLRSKACATAPMSFACADVYRLSSPSFLAPATSLSSRSAPSYRAGFTCASAPAASAPRSSASKGLTSINRFPFDRRPFGQQSLCIVVVNGCGERNLARGDQLCHQSMPGPDLRFRLRQLAKECEALLFAHPFDDRAEPVGVARLDADPADPSRMQQILVRVRHLVWLHEIRVVGDGEEIEPIRHIVTMLRKRLRRQVPELRAVELLQHALPIERLHLRAVQLERIDAIASCARLD